uniref:Putative secreted protein n=1 Tax=Ixodes ricinus TaxID=34613 RepID=A0A6B0UHD1_IXORI
MFLLLLVALLAAPLHLHANANAVNYRKTDRDLKGVSMECEKSVGSYLKEICSNQNATPYFMIALKESAGSPWKFDVVESFVLSPISAACNSRVQLCLFTASLVAQFHV